MSYYIDHGIVFTNEQLEDLVDLPPETTHKIIKTVSEFVNTGSYKMPTDPIVKYAVRGLIKQIEVKHRNFVKACFVKRAGRKNGHLKNSGMTALQASQYLNNDPKYSIEKFEEWADTQEHITLEAYEDYINRSIDNYSSLKKSIDNYRNDSDKDKDIDKDKEKDKDKDKDIEIAMERGTRGEPEKPFAVYHSESELSDLINDYISYHYPKDDTETAFKVISVYLEHTAGNDIDKQLEIMTDANKKKQALLDDITFKRLVETYEDAHR